MTVTTLPIWTQPQQSKKNYFFYCSWQEIQRLLQKILLSNPLNNIYTESFTANYKYMTSQPLFLAILLLSALTAHSQFSKCPADNPLQLASDWITVSNQGQVALTKGADVQCYNYTLATAFSCTPGVAIAVNGLESQYGANLFFSIKAVNSDSNSVIPFIIRTQWGYTQWSRISFAFLAEGSPQIEAGYYQIDTASLSSCNSGKSIAAFIPLASQNSALSSAITFLNGFQISSISVNASYLTPFEVQVVVNAVSKQGISLLLQSTSATQVHAIFVSYVAYDPNIQNLVAGSYVYNKYQATNSLLFTPPIGVSNNNAAFHGFNGFILGNNRANIALNGVLSKGNLTFSSSASLYYLSYNYFFLIGGPCGQCVGYTISYNGNCVAACPPSSYYNGVTCITCTTGQTWDGTKCVDIPKPTPTPTPTPSPAANTTTNSSSSSGNVPSCPVATYWDQQQLRCLPCLSGCSSCVDCYTCSACSAGFTMNSQSLCSQVCGDGKRFVLPCDDGNTVDGDGCSSTCQVEKGFFCAGGSPSSKDTCSKAVPSALSFSSSGQSHQWGKIILNVRVNYLPDALIQSSDCANSCKNILSVKIVSGDSSAVSIQVSYIPTSSYSFSVVIDYQKEPIGLFTAQIGINPSLVSKYFNGINTSSQLTVNVNPSFLAVATTGDSLN